MGIGPRKVDKPLILYGYGKLGHLAEEIFTELNIPLYGIMDKSDDRWFQDPHHQDCLLAICVTMEPYNQVIAPLIAAGWTDIVSVYDIFEAYPECGIGNGWFADPRSEEDVWGIIQVGKKWDGKQSAIHYAYFTAWRLFRLECQHNEFVINTNHSTPLPSTLADIRKRQRVIHWSDSHHTFWNSYGDSGTVYIHQEGKELETLEANIKVFQKHRPSIECAVYHSRDGLWKIEKFLMDNLPDYRWTFRLHAYMGQSAYIYGIPNERNEK